MADDPAPRKKKRKKPAEEPAPAPPEETEPVETQAEEDPPDDPETVDDEPVAQTERAEDEEPAEATTVREWLDGGRISKEMSLLLGLILPVMLLGWNMWQVRAFTVDDSYISFRYARNLARGLGLVYNEGERIEGYTNFLWTVLLAGGIKVGIGPNTFAKVMGAASAVGSLGLTWLISNKLRPYRTLPCIATWLLASTIVFSGYSIFGLETGFFVLLLLAGTWFFLNETGSLGKPGEEEKQGFPMSGVMFGLAGLTRPEAPMFVGLYMLFLGRRMFGKQNLIRLAIFAAPVLLHVAWRHSYYGTWIPNTATAKTGNIDGQIRAGAGYLQNYLNHAGPVLWMGIFGLAIGVAKKRRDLMAIGVIGLAVLGYVTLVGGDWMPFFRFMAPFEPFCFLLVCVGVRSIGDRRERAANLALAAFALIIIAHRGGSIREAQNQFVNKEKKFWDMAAGGTARWLKQNGVAGEIAIGDIGFVGYETDYPVLDLLGLVDPVISKLPGGYTQKVGPGFTDRFFEKSPMYALIISSNMDCAHPSVLGSQVLYRDKRFLPKYSVAGRVALDGGFAWCIFKRKDL